MTRKRRVLGLQDLEGWIRKEERSRVSMSHKQTWGVVLCIPTFHNCCIRHWRQKQDAKYVKTIDPLIGIAIASSDYCVLTARSVAIRIGSILFCLYFTFNFYRLEVYVGVSSVSFLRLVVRVSNQMRGGRAWESAANRMQGRAGQEDIEGALLVGL